MKTKNKRNYSKEKGITLIALVVTIVVLLILAGVSVNALFGNSGIIEKAKEAKNAMTVATEKDQISLALTEWELSNKTEKTTFEKFMKEKFGEDNVETVTENEVIVTMESGNRYRVKTDGTITSTKGVSINKSSLTLELQEGKTVTETLTASLSEITGEITWSNSDNSKATISATKGTSITVTAKAVGETTITATCGDYTATCTVNVEKAIAIGSYVQYNVSYTDMYSGIEYTANNGWRYIGKDDSGNQLIVSTGIPATLNYTYKSNIGNIADGGENSWWATKAEISSTTDTIYKTTKGYDYNTDDGEPNKYVAYSLRYKLDKIPFTYQTSGTTVSTANTGIFRKVGNTTSGTNINLNFKAEGVNVVDVHNLTLAELNRATSKANGTTRTDISLDAGFKDLEETAIGLFNMRKLDGYVEEVDDDGDTIGYSYYLATPSEKDRDGVHFVNYWAPGISTAYTSIGAGVRPVITIPSNVNLTVVK